MTLYSLLKTYTLVEEINILIEIWWKAFGKAELRKRVQEACCRETTRPCRENESCCPKWM